MAEIVAHGGLVDALVSALEVEGVLIVVEIDVHELVKVDGVGAGDKCAVVVGRIEDLDGESLPSAGGTAVSEACPALADGAELLFDGGNQLGFNGRAVGADVGGVDGVGVVVKGVGMLNLEDEIAGEAGGDPLLVEVVGLLLLNAVVAGEVEALAVVGLEVGVRRGGAEVVEAVGEVAVKNHEREMGVGVVVKAIGDENDGGEKDGAAPELGEDVALNAQMADIFGVGGRGDGGDDLRE